MSVLTIFPLRSCATAVTYVFFTHTAPSDKAIVLVHGLTDSPYFLTAIARYFHTQLGYDIYLPLLHCHGLKEPKGMQGVELGKWKANVRFAVKAAAEKATRVSIKI